ncbi:MAG: DNA polymerase IV, partial [Burkholderiales bacterium]|nr:DNA polymerase IV [Burkholderiales bacterium]
MDAFYASVELLRYPELRGMPVVIGGGSRHQPVVATDPVTGEPTRRFSTLRGYAGRGVITTATYEARALGLHSAMGMMKAAQLAPDAVLLPVDFEQYRKYSRLFKAAVRAIAPLVEDRGIDEIYVDLTDVVGPVAEPWARARDVAAEIKRAVRAATGLNCSIGVSPNKLLSKIASDLDKPDGLTIL